MERTERLRLALSASIYELRRVSDRLEAFGRANGLDEGLIRALQLICDEWITNIVVHGYGGGAPLPGQGERIRGPGHGAAERGGRNRPPGAEGAEPGTQREDRGPAPAREDPGRQPDIEIDLEIAGGEVRLTFADGGPPFNPLARPEADVSLPLERREIGGLGIHFLKMLTDRQEYERIGGRNRLTLTKAFNRARQEEENGN